MSTLLFLPGGEKAISWGKLRVQSMSHACEKNMNSQSYYAWNMPAVYWRDKCISGCTVSMVGIRVWQSVNFFFNLVTWNSGILHRSLLMFVVLNSCKLLNKCNICPVSCSHCRLWVHVQPELHLLRQQLAGGWILPGHHLPMWKQHLPGEEWAD